MSQKGLIRAIFFFAVLLVSFRVRAQIPQGEPFVIHHLVGDVIDLQERNAYGLFPEIEGFQSAAFFKNGEGSYLIKITWIDSLTGVQQVKILQRGETNVQYIRTNILHKQLLDNSQTGVSQRPPLDADRIVLELLLGEIGLLGGTFVTAGVSLEDDVTPYSGILFTGLSMIGSSAGVLLIGNTDEQSGSSLKTIQGSAIGIVVGAFMAKVLNSAIPFLLLPPIGGTIGFNLSRQYKVNTGMESALHHFDNGACRIGCCMMVLPISEFRNRMQVTPGLTVQMYF